MSINELVNELGSMKLMLSKVAGKQLKERDVAYVENKAVLQGNAICPWIIVVIWVTQVIAVGIKQDAP